MTFSRPLSFEPLLGLSLESRLERPLGMAFGALSFLFSLPFLLRTSGPLFTSESDSDCTSFDGNDTFFPLSFPNRGDDAKYGDEGGSPPEPEVVRGVADEEGSAGCPGDVDG